MHQKKEKKTQRQYSTEFKIQKETVLQGFYEVEKAVTDFFALRIHNVFWCMERNMEYGT